MLIESRDICIREMVAIIEIRIERLQTSGEHYLGQSFYQIKEEPIYYSDEKDFIEEERFPSSHVNIVQNKVMKIMPL